MTDVAVAGRRRFFRWLAVICGGGLAIRIWYAAAVVDPRNPKSGLSDEVFYHLQARLVADGHGFLNPFLHYASASSGQRFDEPTALHPPLYTIFLAIPAKLGLTSMLTQRIITILLGIGTVFLLGVLARRLAGDRAGLLAAGLAAVSPALWMNDSVIGLETLYGFLVAMSLLTFYKFWNDRRLRWALLLAVWLALAALTRSEGVILVVFIAVPTVLFLPDIDWRRRVGILVAMAAVVMVVMAPWVIRNLTTFEEPTTLGTGFGVVLAYSNCDATYSGPHLGYWDDGCSLPRLRARVRRIGVRRRAREKGVDYLARPRRASADRRRRPDRQGLGGVPAVPERRTGRLLRTARQVASWAGLISYWLLLPCAIGGLVVLRRRRVPIFPILAIAASVTMTVAMASASPGTGSPVDVVLPMLAAVAIDGCCAIVNESTFATSATSTTCAPSMRERDSARRGQVASATMDAPDPRRARDNALNTELLRAELPSGALRRRGLPPVALRREPVRTRHPARGRRRRRAGRALRAHPPAVPRSRRRGPRGVLAARGRRAAAPSARATSSSSAPRSTTRRPPPGWQFSTGVCNDKSIGAVVKYMGWKTPGPLPVKLCVPDAHRTRRHQHAGRRRVPGRAAEFDELTAGTRRLRRRAVDQLVHHRVPAVAARLPERAVRAALERRPRRDHDHRHALRCARRGRAEGVRPTRRQHAGHGRRDGRRRLPLPPRARTPSTRASTGGCASAGCNRRAASSRRRCTSSCVRSRPPSTRTPSASTPSSSSTWTRTDGRPE